jgi:hypothetical protein
MATTSLPPPLSAEEVAFFVKEGWLLKRGVLDPAQCAAARDALWSANTSSKYLAASLTNQIVDDHH